MNDPFTMKNSLTKDDPIGWYQCVDRHSQLTVSFYWDGMSLRHGPGHHYHTCHEGFSDFVRMVEECQNHSVTAYTGLCQKIHDACDKAGVPSHHPKMAGAALPKPMLPQERLELLAKTPNRMWQADPWCRGIVEENKKLLAMKDGCDCESITQRGKVFCCPACNGGHFGSEIKAGAVDVRVCHDQFNIGCRWKGPDSKCYVKPSEAVERLRENVADIDSLAAEMLNDDDNKAKREKKRSDRQQRILMAIGKIVLPQGKETMVQAVERVKRLADKEIEFRTVTRLQFTPSTDDILRVLRSIADSGEGELFGHCPPEALKLKASIDKLRLLAFHSDTACFTEAIKKNDADTSDLVRRLCSQTGLSGPSRPTEDDVRQHLITVFNAVKAIQRCKTSREHSAF